MRSFFHPLAVRWFERVVGEPTDVQREAWPRIGRGEHVLVTAPTGSGKTLAAFWWALNQLVSGAWETGRTRVLYVSPLKALNNDIQRNLIGPLQELKRVFREAGEPFPDIRVLTRSGDTPQSDRRRMVRRPPEILITTPESLHLLVSSKGGRSILNDLSTVILDEIHAVAGNKRGVLLISAVERLVDFSGEFQRVALSATIRPVKAAAGWVGGFTIAGDGEGRTYTPRPVSVVKSTMEKRFDIRVRLPAEAVDRPASTPIWEPLSEAFKRIIQENRSTLLFTNSRRLSEKIAFFINKGEPGHVAYAHHGSLAREIRRVVEQKLKNGELKAIVATSSLELGIDVGSLDEVVLVQAPPSISAALQRIGRAGHGVGRVSRGALFPTHSHDFLEAAVLIPAIRERDIEELRPVVCPLDVLAQVIVSMAGAETWPLEELLARLKRSHPFHTLTRERFDLVLNMLAGRYANTRIRELQPRVHLDRVDNTVAAGKGALLALYMSGGVIPDRGSYRLRHVDGGGIIGDLDEEFVWEARLGQVFTLGAQNWKISRITHDDVFVAPAGSGASAPPFWRAEENNRDFHFSRAIGRFLETAEARLDDPDFPEYLETVHAMDQPSAQKLMEFLQRQRQAAGGPLPHRHRLLVEFTARGPGGAPGNMAVLHTFWGGRVNRPYAMALSVGWEERFGARPEIYPTNDCIVLMAPHDIGVEELLSLVTPGNVESLLRRGLEDSGFFGARFRECAGRALLLSRRKIKERTPLWLNRLRSQKLMEAVSGYADFPILLEAWRACLHDEFDLPALRTVLSELETGVIAGGRVHTSHPSPMALAGAWRQINEYMYKGDGRTSRRPTELRESLLHEAAFTPGLRPAASGETAAEFELKRQRLFPGYAPETSLDLLQWVKERVVIPVEEWDLLLAAVDKGEGVDAAALVEEAGDKIVRIRPLVPAPGNPLALVCALETAPRIISGLYPGPG
ncbi:MAG: DEAD/DEAH box helicase, partial [Desulfobacterales bacterium]|nr:DEAD/DEAH box helicase [Desulfobacterales bacterium]